MVDLYTSQVGFPSLSPPSVQPGGLASLPGGSIIGNALSGAGETLSAIGRAVREGAEETAKAKATTEYLTRLDALQTQYAQDPDYATAPARFAADRAQLEQELLSGFSPETAAQMELNFRRVGLGAQGTVDSSSLTRMGDAAAANLDAQEGLLLNRVMAAKSPLERNTLIAQHEAAITGNVGKGLISAQNGEARRQRFAGLIDSGDLLQLIRTNPGAALEALQDPVRFPNLDPVERQRYINQAQDGFDEQEVAAIRQRAQFEPEAVQVELGRTDPAGVGVPGGTGRGEALDPAKNQFLRGRLSGAAAADPTQHVDQMQPAMQNRLALLFAGGVLPAAIADKLTIGSGTRTHERQTELWNRKVAAIAAAHPSWSRAQVEERADDEVARPGGSQHEVGAAADLYYDGQRLDSAPKEVVDAVHAAARQVGLVFPLSNEDWHVELAGARGGGTPAGASANPVTAEWVFQRGMIPQESSGNPSALSPRGAAGIAQVMPDTARYVARKLGIADLDGMTNAEIIQRMRSDPALNYKLGLAYFQEQLAAFNGNFAVAMAAYNAGPGQAARWQREAIAKYGPAFTAEQLISVVDVKETRDYIAEVHARLGVATDGGGLSPAARQRASGVVDEQLAAEQRARRQQLLDQASFDRSDNQFEEMFRAGNRVDPAALMAYRQQQQAAADAGSAEARQELRNLDRAEQNAPLIREAYGLAPEALEIAIAKMRGALAAGAGDGEMFRRVQAFEAVRDTVAKGRAENPIALGETAGLFQPTPIDPNADFDARGTLTALGYRAYQARAAAARWGGPLLPFKPEEAAALKQRWTDAGVGDRRAMLAGLAAAMPDERSYEAAIDQITGGTDATAAVAGLIARDRPDTAALVLRGAELMNTPGVEKPAAELRTAFAEKVGGSGIYPPGSPGLEQVAVAAAAIYVARRGATGALWADPDETAMAAAIDEAAGDIVDRNGKFPAPPGVPRAAAIEALDNLTQADLDLFGGAFDVNGQPFDMAPPENLRWSWQGSFLGDNATLTALLPFGSTYLVTIGDAPVVTRDGKPLVIDLRQIVTRHAAAAGGIAREGAALRQDRAEQERQEERSRLPPWPPVNGIGDGIGAGGLP